MRDSYYYRDEASYRVGGNNYSIKDELKKAPGAFWDAPRKQWVLPCLEVSLEIIRRLRIPRRIKVLRAAFCHEPEEEIYVSEDELMLVGTKPFTKEVLKQYAFCTRCDSTGPRGVEIKRLENEETPQSNSSKTNP